MESKRVLWIVAAVGLFLLVVIGTALLLYAPLKYKKTTSSQFVAQDGAWVRPDMIDYSTVKEVAAATENSGSTTESSAPAAQNTDSSSKVQNLTVYADNTNIYSQNGTVPQTITVPLTGTGNPAASAPAAQTAANTSSAAENSSQVSAQSSSKPASVPSTSTPASSSAGSASSVTKPASTAAASSSAASAGTSSGSGKTTAAAKPAQTALPDQFWVQVASFTSKKNAEDARSALAQEQISGEVFTWTHSDGTIYYRLRVGPYTTENEAEYWHARIKLIDIFANTSTYVTNSSGKAPN